MSPSRLAHYEVIDLLGRGGMGEVHRARDTKLGREVALKLLPPELAQDAERLARFRREAQLLASLHHPNIASIFGLEEADGRSFLVMELAQGRDLTERIGRGAVPEEEAIDIARQIAAGLEEAHEKGIVHRDLKPANIKLGDDGKVKILDFGLARAFVGETTAEENLQNSPTITAAATRGGVILGTAAYMSPEQARGKTVDRRADIWAFGVVLYEMLTGKRLFDGETVSDTLAAVLRADIGWDALPEAVSPGMRRLMERCLERNPLKRLRDIGEARIFLEAGAKDASLLSLTGISSASGITPLPSERRFPVWAIALGAVLFAAAGLFVGSTLLGRSEPTPLLHLTLPKPSNGVFHLASNAPGPVALSPDGSMVVYSVRDDAGTVRLHLRRLDSADATVLSGTEGGVYPFWSADGRHVGFMADQKLKKVAIAGGPPTTLCPAQNMKGGAWNRDGVVVFAPSHNTPLFRVSASGGQATELTKLAAEGENSHRHPRFLPDGKHFLYLARVDGAAVGEHRVYYASLDGGEPKLLTTSQTAAEYSAGHLLTVREGILLATPFDPGRGELGESSVPLVEGVLVVSQGAACGLYSPTADGMLVYQVTLGSAERYLEWLGRGDVGGGRVGDPGELFRPRVSPDGTRAVVEVADRDTGDTDLWLVDLESGLRTRFTFDEGEEYEAEWTPDGREILYTSEVDSTARLMRRPVEGTGGAEILLEGRPGLSVTGVSPDGSTAILRAVGEAGDEDVHLLSLATGTVTSRVVEPDVQSGGTISPDGRWLAHHARSANAWRTLVRPVSGGDRVWQVNKDEGVYPMWAPDGKRLFYVGMDGAIQEVPVDGSGETFRSGAPKDFARIPIPNPLGRAVSLAPDGERILHVAGETSEDESGYLHVVTDWRRMVAK